MIRAGTRMPCLYVAGNSQVVSETFCRLSKMAMWRVLQQTNRFSSYTSSYSKTWRHRSVGHTLAFPGGSPVVSFKQPLRLRLRLTIADQFAARRNVGCENLINVGVHRFCPCLA